MTDGEAPRAIRLAPEADRVMIVGSCGDGKSVIARYIVQSFAGARVVICDSKRDIRWPGSVRARSPGEIRSAARRGARVIRWVPATFARPYMYSCWEAIHDIRGPLIVWVDEASEHCTPTWCPEGLRLDVTQGRAGRDPRDASDEKRGPKLYVICTQRLSETHPVMRTQAEHIIVMCPPPAEIDLRAIAGTMRRRPYEIESELQGLMAEHGRFSHLWYVKPTNELRRMAPVPLPRAGRPRRPRSSPLPPDEEAL